MRKKIIHYFIVCIILFVSNLYAVENIANDQLLRQQEIEKKIRETNDNRPNVLSGKLQESITDKLPIEESPCFEIKDIVFDDANTQYLWAINEANSANDPIINRCIGSNGIYLVRKRVQNILMAKGYITSRIIIKPQDLTKGVLKLSIIEGKVSKISFQESDERPFWKNALPFREGDILNLRNIEQGLENFKRLPTVNADFRILPSSDAKAPDGSSDLAIIWKQPKIWRLSESIDDSGTRSTGKLQSATTFSLDHLWSLNDTFYWSANQTIGGKAEGKRGNSGNSFHYSLPFGYWLLGLNVNSSHYYQTISGTTQSYVYSGDSFNKEAKISYLAYRDGVRKTTLSMAGWTRSSRNFINDTTVENQRRYTVGVDFSLSHRELIGKSTIDAVVTHKRGFNALGALKAPEEAQGGGSSRPRITTVELKLDTPLFDLPLRYNGVLRIQKNHTDLIPSDRFAIGSRYSVRGFDGESLLSSEEGYFFRNDFLAPLPSLPAQAYIAIDHGELGGKSANSLSGKSLTGGVIGLKGSYKALYGDIFLGIPLQKPSHFSTSSHITGFNFYVSF